MKSWIICLFIGLSFASCATIDTLQPREDSSAFEVRGKNYEEIWKAVVKTASRSLTIVESNKEKGNLRGQGVPHMAKGEEIVSIFVRPIIKIAPVYSIEVKILKHAKVQIPGQDLTTTIISGIKTELNQFSVQASHSGMFCPETEYEAGYKKNLPTVDLAEIVQSKKALLPNGKLKCQISFNYETVRNNKKMRIEEGTYDGIKYRIYYSDGSGTIQGLPTNTLDYVNDKHGTNWATQCKLDEMNDTHWCSLERKDLMVGIGKDGTPFVKVGVSHYPNSKIAVRIDKNKPFSASENFGFTKEQSQSIIEQFRKGKFVLTRYQEWPYQSNEDKSFELFGFPQGWEILQKLYNSIESQQNNRSSDHMRSEHK